MMMKPLTPSVLLGIFAFYRRCKKNSHNLLNCFSFCYYFGIFIIVGAVTVTSSASPSNYNPYQYDLTIPQYTPDGRLLQVEYAQKASQEHSIPIIVATTTINICDSLAHHKNRHNHENIDITEKYDPEQITIMIAGHRTRTGQQSRLIVLPSKITTMCGIHNSNNSNNHQNAGESMMVIAISGILSDALAILQMIQSFRIQEYRTIGGESGRHSSSSSSSNGSSTMVRRIAYQIASTCQSRTITGGKRPYGATLWIMSTHHNDRFHHQQASSSSSSSYFQPLLLHQIDPSGAIYDILLQRPPTHHNAYQTRSKQMNVAAVAVLGGGDGTITTKIQRRLQNDWLVGTDDDHHHGSSRNNTGDTSTTNHQSHNGPSTKAAQSRIGHILSIAMEEYQNHYSLNAHASGDDDSKIDAKKANTSPNPQHSPKSNDSTRFSAVDVYDHLEVVLVSSKRGTIKLNSHQIDHFIQVYKAKQPLQEHVK